MFGDAQNSWVGTRKVWNQHAYFVSQRVRRPGRCLLGGGAYGAIPSAPKDNWTLSWLDNFRQNVQDEGIFDAADATVSLTVDCKTPVVVHVAVRNAGFAPLPAGVDVEVHKADDDSLLGTVTTDEMLLPGQTEILDLTIDQSLATTADSFIARIVTGPNQTWVECRDDNDESDPAHAYCGPG